MIREGGRKEKEQSKQGKKEKKERRLTISDTCKHNESKRAMLDFVNAFRLMQKKSERKRKQDREKGRALKNE